MENRAFRKFEWSVWKLLDCRILHQIPKGFWEPWAVPKPPALSNEPPSENFCLRACWSYRFDWTPFWNEFQLIICSIYMIIRYSRSVDIPNFAKITADWKNRSVDLIWSRVSVVSIEICHFLQQADWSMTLPLGAKFVRIAYMQWSFKLVVQQIKLVIVLPAWFDGKINDDF